MARRRDSRIITKGAGSDSQALLAVAVARRRWMADDGEGAMRVGPPGALVLQGARCKVRGGWRARRSWAASGAVQVSQQKRDAATGRVARQHLTGDADSTTRVRIGRRPGSRRVLGGVAEKGEVPEQSSFNAQAFRAFARCSPSPSPSPPPPSYGCCCSSAAPTLSLPLQMHTPRPPISTRRPAIHLVLSLDRPTD